MVPLGLGGFGQQPPTAPESQCTGALLRKSPGPSPRLPSSCAVAAAGKCPRSDLLYLLYHHHLLFLTRCSLYPHHMRTRSQPLTQPCQSPSRAAIRSVQPASSPPDAFDLPCPAPPVRAPTTLSRLTAGAPSALTSPTAITEDCTPKLPIRKRPPTNSPFLLPP